MWAHGSQEQIRKTLWDECDSHGDRHWHALPAKMQVYLPTNGFIELRFFETHTAVRLVPLIGNRFRWKEVAETERIFALLQRLGFGWEESVFVTDGHEGTCRLLAASSEPPRMRQEC